MYLCISILHKFIADIMFILSLISWKYHSFWARFQNMHVIPKGQLISKCLFCIFNSPKKRTKKFDYITMEYGTSSRIVFLCFLGELKTPKRHFEINWPLFGCAQIRNQDFMNYNRFFFSWKPLLFFHVLIKSKSHAC